jgi:deoxycytidine triphosphate deaminase
MLLVDRELRRRLAELNITTGDGPAFEPDDQIQPCSIDMRFSSTFWRPIRPPSRFFGHRRNFTIDFRGSKFTEINPRRHWKQYALEAGDCVTLKPGEMILGRTHETFTVPKDCTATLDGRSSFARIGLAIHVTGGFINPGWRGHMPLTLVNHGRFNLRIPAYLSLCQVSFRGLGETPDRVYGQDSLHSKYVDDDGGPSYWWRDRMLTRLLASMGRTPAGPEIQTRLLDRVGSPSDAILERLERLVDTQAYTSFGSVDELLLIFAEREDKKRMFDRIFKAVTIGVFPTMLALSLGSLFERPIGFLHYAVWALTVLTLPISLLAMRTEPGEYLGAREQKELERLRRDQLDNKAA